jgi:hypothetical protein
MVTVGSHTTYVCTELGCLLFNVYGILMTQIRYLGTKLFEWLKRKSFFKTIDVQLDREYQHSLLNRKSETYGHDCKPVF